LLVFQKSIFNVLEQLGPFYHLKLSPANGQTTFGLGLIHKRHFGTQLALFTRDILTDNIAIKRYCDKNIFLRHRYLKAKVSS